MPYLAVYFDTYDDLFQHLVVGLPRSYRPCIGHSRACKKVVCVVHMVDTHTRRWVGADTVVAEQEIGSDQTLIFLMVWSSDAGTEVGIGRDHWSQTYLDECDWVAAAFDVERLKRIVLDRWVIVTLVLGADVIDCTTMDYWVKERMRTQAVVRTCMGAAGPNWTGCPDWAYVCRSLEWVSDYAGGRDDQTEGRGGCVALDNFEDGE